MHFIQPLQAFLQTKHIVEFSSIQQAVFKVWPRQNVVGIAETGSGKTFAYLLPALNQIDVTLNKPQAVVFVPTKELKWQILTILNDIKASFTGLKVSENFNSNAHLIVSLIGKDIILHETIKYVVFDEVDMFLEDSSQAEWINCVQLFQKHKPHFGFFSATLFNEQLQQIRKQVAPLTVVNQKKRAWKHSLVKHFLLNLNGQEPFAGLLALLNYHHNEQVLVFCSNAKSLKQLTSLLAHNQLSFKSLHGQLTPNERKHIFTSAANNTVRVLVVSDLLARGIDLPHFSVVISWDLPLVDSFYIHRSGRVARFNSWGNSYVFDLTHNQHKLTKFAHKGILFNSVHLERDGTLKFPQLKQSKQKPAVSSELKTAIKRIKAGYKKVKPNYKKRQKQQIAELFAKRKQRRSWKNF